MAVGGGLLRGAARAGRGVLDLLLPPRCLGCGVEVTGEVGLCPACWSGLHLLAPPWCRCCGYPLPHALADQPLRYDARSARLVLGFKRGGRLEGVAQFARWMAQAGEELLADADLVLPVPLHRWRLVQRGFNQSALLAQRLARLTGRAWSPSVLLRHRRTASQQGLGAAERSENITAASFRVRRPERVAGQRVLLVDDVLTTGATLAACVTVLRRAGAARVDALTLARVAKLDETSI